MQQMAASSRQCALHLLSLVTLKVMLITIPSGMACTASGSAGAVACGSRVGSAGSAGAVACGRHVCGGALWLSARPVSGMSSWLPWLGKWPVLSSGVPAPEGALLWLELLPSSGTGGSV